MALKWGGKSLCKSSECLKTSSNERRVGMKAAKNAFVSSDIKGG